MAAANLPYYALYGNIRMLKAWCPDCERYAFVIDKLLQCCDSPLEAEAQKYKRESEPEGRRHQPPRLACEQQLALQHHRCFYCDRRFGSIVHRGLRVVHLRTHWDHMIPFSYARDNRNVNFVAACHVCNGLKSRHCFESIEEAKIFLAMRWFEKGYSD